MMALLRCAGTLLAYILFQMCTVGVDWREPRWWPSLASSLLRSAPSGQTYNLENRGVPVSPLECAVVTGNYHALRALLAHVTAEKDAGYVNCVGPTGHLPLVIAAATGKDKACGHLLTAGADPFKADELGDNAVWAAAGSGDEMTLGTVMATVRNMKKLGGPAVLAPLLHPGPAGQTLAQWAVQRRCDAVIVYLNALGVEMNKIHTGETPLKLACQVGP